MAITRRNITTITGLLGMYACLCAAWSSGQASDIPKVAPSEAQKSYDIKLDLPRLVYPYYEWVAKDIALAWVKKPDGSIAAVSLTGERHEEKRISGANDIRTMEDARPYGLKMSPDGSKILYLMGAAGSPAGGWRVGTLNGTSYTHGALVDVQGRDPVWKRNSKEWVSLVGDNLHISAVHYYIDGVTPSVTIPIKDFAPKRDETSTYVPHILGLRQDGIAIVPVRDNKDPTKSIDF